MSERVSEILKNRGERSCAGGPPLKEIRGGDVQVRGRGETELHRKNLLPLPSGQRIPNATAAVFFASRSAVFRARS